MMRMNLKQTYYLPIYEHAEQIQVPQPKGCEQCSHTGFMGRTAIYEIVPIDEARARLIHSNAAEFEIGNHVRANAGSIEMMVYVKCLRVKPRLKRCYV